jgi:hypothetical protein
MLWCMLVLLAGSVVVIHDYASLGGEHMHGRLLCKQLQLQCISVWCVYRFLCIHCALCYSQQKQFM